MPAARLDAGTFSPLAAPTPLLLAVPIGDAAALLVTSSSCSPGAVPRECGSGLVERWLADDAAPVLTPSTEPDKRDEAAPLGLPAGPDTVPEAARELTGSSI